MRSVLSIAALLLASCYLVGCDPETEGCLDYRALSVNVAADLACKNCCVFPSLQLQVVAVNPDGEVVSSNTFFDDAGDSVRLLRFAFYVSDITLELADGALIPLNDTLSYRATEADEFVREDISVLRFNPLSGQRREIGQLLEEREVVAVRFAVGLPAELSSLDPRAQDNGTTLGLQADSLVSAVVGYRTAFLSKQRVATADTVFTEVPSAETPTCLRLLLPEPVLLPRSYNLSVVMTLSVKPFLALPPGSVNQEDFVDLVRQHLRVRQATLTR